MDEVHSHMGETVFYKKEELRENLAIYGKSFSPRGFALYLPKIPFFTVHKQLFSPHRIYPIMIGRTPPLIQSNLGNLAIFGIGNTFILNPCSGLPQNYKLLMYFLQTHFYKTVQLREFS